MNTSQETKFMISAKYLGPVLLLDGELTKNAQNLVFARNGTGKSFLSRAFRYLDQHGQGKALDDAARNLVSDESKDGEGSFAFSRGTNPMGTLRLEKTGDIATARVSDTIFHVFSEDFVQEELREPEYNLDGKIENQIAVDSTNIQIKDAQDALEKAQADEQAAAKSLQDKFDSEKLSELNDKAGVRKQLKEYAALSFQGLFENYLVEPAPPDQSFADILKDLDNLKAVPAEPVYPQTVDIVGTEDIDLEALAESIQRTTSPSSVSEAIKKKIDAHHNFIGSGVDIVKDEHRETCPFCEQDITAPDPKAIIDAYVGYFSDEEEKHKSELRRYLGYLNRKEDALTQIETQLTRQLSHYDALKRYLPSKKDTNISDVEGAIKLTRAAITATKGVIEHKMGALSVEHSLPEEDLTTRIADLNKIIEDNNAKVIDLNRAVEKSDDERKTLQRKACAVFEREFAIRNWIEIESLRAIKDLAKTKAGELAALEKSNPSTDARARVADTFELLLREFFSEKYVFDRDRFVLKRGDHEMTRGPHRTLSDGEKTAIAFCYFVACVHRKVSANSDYRRLFLVFDDPVTSMSYDFVFAIAQTLKSLNISDQGEISLNPGQIDGNKYLRPELLILTHSSYFFNILVSNRVVHDNAAFALHTENGEHKIAPLREYVAPFQDQLKDIYEIANGRHPDHSTGNAIRSVLEAIGRFCRPDKSGSLSDFVRYLAGEEGISVKSVLINSLCHGTYYDEIPPPDDLKLACCETLKVVEKYAAGHLEILKGGKRT